MSMTSSTLQGWGNHNSLVTVRNTFSSQGATTQAQHNIAPNMRIGNSDMLKNCWGAFVIHAISLINPSGNVSGLCSISWICVHAEGGVQVPRNLIKKIAIPILAARIATQMNLQTQPSPLHRTHHVYTRQAATFYIVTQSPKHFPHNCI